MESKFATPITREEEPAPPSYNETMVPGTISKLEPLGNLQTSPTTQAYSNQIQDQLQSMTTQINSLQTQRSLATHAKDEKVLSLLATQIQQYLANFANSGLQKGSLTLVPASGIEDQNAMPTMHNPKQTQEYNSVVRVIDKEADEEAQADTWFWKDETMARRLASYLQPDSDPYTARLPARKQDTASSTSRSFWGRLKKNPPQPVAQPGPMPLQSTAEKIMMNVKAEEIVFRTENAFGLFETERGWAVILTLTVILAQP
jgi:hypothetical protein